jgi:hypothetical protein
MPEDPMCPPGTQLDVICDQYGCWEECVGYPEPCPPGTYLDLVCDQYGCWEECVGDPEPGMQP